MLSFRFALLLILLSLNLLAQEQKVADSLKNVHKTQTWSDSSEFQILHEISFNDSDPEEILKYSQLLLEKASVDGNTIFVYIAYVHHGNAYRLKGNYDQAFESYFKALEHAERNKLTSQTAASFCNLADTYSVVGDHKNAQLFYNKCIAELAKYGDKIQLAIALLNSGDNLLQQDKLDSALGNFLKASTAFHEENYMAGKGYSIGNMGLIYARQGKNELAEETLKESISILESLGDSYAVSAYLIHMVDIYLETEEHWLSLEYANLAYEYASKMGYKEQIKDASLRLSRIYEKLNDSGQAFDFLKTYITYRDSLKNESIIYRMSELRREYELAQVRKATERNVNNEPKINNTEKTNFYALIFGVSDYQNNDDTLDDLVHPVTDAGLLHQTLVSKYVFDEDKIIFVKNPDRADIINSLEALSASITARDNLLIFYAGHGVWDEKLQIGYWLPSDAKSNSKANWISNSTIRDYISGLPAKHTLLISDACFSGGIFKTRALAGGIDEYGFAKLYKLPSRKAMTSGTLTTVPDESQFMKYLIKRLLENKEEYLTARQLYSQIEGAILNNTTSVPQYGTIQNTGDEGGEFIFVKKGSLIQKE